VRCTSGSRGKVPGERKTVIRDDADVTAAANNNNNNNNNNKLLKQI
jgi:hypothetical protein